MTETVLSYFSTDGYFAPLPATSSAGQLVTLSNPSTAVTVTNPSTAVTITNPTTQVNTLSSGPITGTVNTLSSGPVLVLSSGPATIAGTVTVLTASSGFLSRSLSSGTVTLSSAIAISSGLVSQSTQPWIVDFSSTGITLGTTPKYITVTSAGAITLGSSVACKVFSINAFTTTLIEKYLQIYAVSSSGVTVGTTLPVLVLPLPMYSTAATAPAMSEFPSFSNRGMSFSTGVSAAATTTTTGATLAAGTCHVNIEMST